MRIFIKYQINGRHNFANALWGRGNSWYTAGIVDYLEIVTLPKSVERYLLEALKSQVDALIKIQDKSGLWHTILDDNTSYLETSASAAFAYGILKAIRKGYLPKEYEQYGLSAYEGVKNQIDKNGIVGGVSYGTPVFYTIEEYKNIEICPMPYGQSMAIILLIERLLH